MFVLSCLDIPNIVYLASSLIVGLLFFILFLLLYQPQSKSQGPIVSDKRQSLPQRFSHALKMHIFSNTNPQFPKTSLKAVSDPFPSNTWLDRCMQIAGWSRV